MRILLMVLWVKGAGSTHSNEPIMYPNMLPLAEEIGVDPVAAQQNLACNPVVCAHKKHTESDHPCLGAVGLGPEPALLTPE